MLVKSPILRSRPVAKGGWGVLVGVVVPICVAVGVAVGAPAVGLGVDLLVAAAIVPSDRFPGARDILINHRRPLDQRASTDREDQSPLSRSFIESKPLKLNNPK